MERIIKTSESLTGKASFDLIEACRKEDPQAQLQIYKLYSRAMYYISLGIVNDPGIAEDIIHESFIDAFEKIGKFSGTLCFEEWLKKIVQTRSAERNYGIVPSRNSVFVKSLYRKK